MFRLTLSVVAGLVLGFAILAGLVVLLRRAARGRALDRIDRRAAAEAATADDAAGEREVLCSGCYQVFPESRVHVLPFFNEEAGGYVTTYRCDGCWLTAIDQTRARLAGSADEAEIASAAAFFGRHGVFIMEYRRGDPPPVVKGVVVALIDRLRAGAMRLAVGPTRPL